MTLVKRDPLTPEQKAERLEARRAERRARDAEFPPAFYEMRFGDTIVQLTMEPGDPDHLTVRLSGRLLSEPDSPGPDGWSHATFFMEDARGLAELIAALSARLDLILEHTNNAVDQIKQINVRRAERLPKPAATAARPEEDSCDGK